MAKARWSRLVMLLAVLLAVTPVAAKAPDQDDGLSPTADAAVDG